MQNGLHIFGILLLLLPRLGFGEVLVAEAGEVHQFGLRLAETVLFDAFADALRELRNLFHHLFFEVGELSQFGNNATVVLVCQHNRAVDEVAEDGQQLVVVLGLEVAPCEVGILGFRRNGGEHITEGVLLAGELLKVLVQPDGPVAGGRDLVAFEVQELVGGHIFGENVAAFRLQHAGEDDAVEHNVVFPNEMNQLCIRIFPPFFPVGAALGGGPLLGGRDITDGGIEPDVEHLAFGFGERHFHAPREVAGDGAGVQSRLNPRLALTVHIHLPVIFVTFENPLFQPRFVLIQRKIPVFRLLHHRRIAAKGRFRIDEVGGVQRGAARLALVTVSPLVVAVGTLARDVAVGEELFRLLVVILLGGLFHQFSFII